MVLVIILAGCGGGGGGGSATTSTPPSGESITSTSRSAQATSRAESSSAQSRACTVACYQVGELTGPLASALTSSLTRRSLYDGQAIDAPLVMAGSAMDQVGTRLASAMMATFANHKPIVLVQATEKEINALLGTLGRTQDFRLPPELPEGKAYAEIFAVDSEASGDDFTWVLYPPTDAVDPATKAACADTAANQCARVDLFLDWLDKSGGRTQALQTARVAAEQAAEGDLRRLANAHVTTVTFERGMSTYQVSYYVWSCHSFHPTEGESDWFYVQQTCMLNPLPLYAGVRSYFKGELRDWCYVYAGAYTMDNWIPASERADDPPSPLVTLLKSTPESVNEVTKVTSGLSHNLGGKVGFNGKLGGEVSYGISFNHSETFDVTDCKVSNRSISRGSNAEWRYDLKRAQQYRWGAVYRALSEPPVLARSNFQPVNQWIWKVPAALRDDPSGAGRSFTSRFSLTTVITYGGENPWDGARHEENEYTWSIRVPLAYPPVVVAPANLSFKATPGCVPVDVTVTRDWKATSSQSWCTLSPTSGGADNPRTYVTVDRNTTGADRTATVTIRTADGKGEAKIAVFQSRYD